MSEQGGEQDYFDDADNDEVGVTPITFANPLEESANRYWRASRIWRDKQESTWNTGDMIRELRGIYRYRGLAPILAERLMEDVIHDRRPIISRLIPPLVQEQQQQ